MRFLKLILCFTLIEAHSQNSISFNNAFAVMSNSVQLTIDNPNSNAIVNSNGNIISENEHNIVKWHVQNNTGNYQIPFTTLSFNKIPLLLNITSAGTALDGSVLFSTYETVADNNQNYPSDVTHLNSNCRDSVGLFTVDRFWMIDAQGYTTKPTPEISFGYDNSPNEIGGSNTIIESKLKAQRFNNISNSWETPQKLYGIANTGSKTVSNVQVSPTDFYKSWTLVDSSIMKIPISVTTPSLVSLCAGSAVTIDVIGASTYTLLPTNTVSTNSFVISPNTSTTYTVIGSIGTGTALCFSDVNASNTVTVNVNSAPSITTVVNDVKCFGESTGAITTMVNASSAFTFTWSNGSNVGSINNLTAGIYNVFVQDANLCATSKTVSVNQPSVISVSETNNTPSCDDKPTGSLDITITGGVANYNVLWSNGQSSTSLSQLPSSVYTATITDANGCQAFFNSIVNEEKCLITLIPQLISPNADGKNDLFYINTISYYPNNKLEIYNRWGNLVYLKDKYNNDFDGKSNMSNTIGSGLLPAATYFVVFDFGDSKTEPYSGYLEIRY